MRDNQHPKDGFSVDMRRMSRGQGEDLVLTDEEIEQALFRLQSTIEAEGIRADSELWSAADEPSMVRQRSSTAPATTVASIGTSQKSDKHEDHPRVGKLPRAATRRWRRLGIGTAAAVALVGVLASPLGGKAMAAAMQTFYFHNLVGVGQSDLNQIQQALANASGANGTQSIDLKQYGSVDVSGGTGGYEGNLTLAAAQKLVSYPIKKLPGYTDQQNGINYMPGNEVTFHLNIGAINGLVQKLGGKTLFPSSVNGEPITVDIPAQVSEQVMANGGKDMFLTEMKIPSVQVPGNVNMDEVKQALMDLPFLPSDIQQSLARSTNWQDTLYVPSNGKVTDLSINGYSAVLQVMPQGAERSIVWLENGILYQLSGSAFSTDASIVSEAKELSR